MTSLRKKLQAKLRRKFCYATAPTNCYNGVVLFKPGENPQYNSGTYLELGWHREKNMFVTLLNENGSARGSLTISFEELEAIYNISKELEKEWGEKSR